MPGWEDHDVELPAIDGTLIRLQVDDLPGNRDPEPLWLWTTEHAGETSVRLNLLADWRDAEVFTDAERAALKLTEQGTRIADAAGGVTDEAWANAAKHYDTDRRRL
jgi:alkylhydroperoxidase family enzyme